MYTQFSGQLNAQTNSPGLWERISGRLSRWVRFLVQEHNRRKAVRLLAKLDNRILRDIGKAESASPGGRPFRPAWMGYWPSIVVFPIGTQKRLKP